MFVHEKREDPKTHFKNKESSRFSYIPPLPNTQDGYNACHESWAISNLTESGA